MFLEYLQYIYDFYRFVIKKGEVMKKSRLILFLFLIIGSQVNFTSEVERAMTWSKLVDSEEKKEVLLKAIAQTQKMKKDITFDVLGYFQRMFLSKIRLEKPEKQAMIKKDFEKIIYDKSRLMVVAEEGLKYIIDKTISKSEPTDIQEGYMAQIRRSLMAWYGYEVTEEQKKARQHIDSLTIQKKVIQDWYDLIILDDTLEASEKNILKERYKAVLARIDNEIDQQQVIITGRWNLLKKAAVAIGAAAAATVTGLLFTYSSWFGAESR